MRPAATIGWLGILVWIGLVFYWFSASSMLSAAGDFSAQDAQNDCTGHTPAGVVDGANCVITFNADGDFTPPVGVSLVTVQVWGGGGGSGGVGLTGGTANGGDAGGNSSIGGYIAQGGAGGSGALQGNLGLGGAGGAAAGGTPLTGTAGADGSTPGNDAKGGNGGAAAGPGGGATSTTTAVTANGGSAAGTAGNAPGGGAGGAARNAGGTNNDAAAGGGGGAGYTTGSLAVTVGVPVAVTVGAGGTAGTGSEANGAAGAAGRVVVTYTLPVAASTNADLATLTLSAGTLAPVFDAATTTYTASVANAVTTITVTATTADGNASINISGQGASPQTFGLNEGPNLIPVVVTAEDNTTTKTYNVTVTRAAAVLSTDATLSALTLSAGTLTPAFASGTFSYTASVGAMVASIDVTATTTNGNATLGILGNPATSGAPQTVALTVGANVIDIIVLAEDGATALQYTVTVTRAAPPEDACQLDGNLTPLTVVPLHGPLVYVNDATNLAVGAQVTSTYIGWGLTSTTPMDDVWVRIIPAGGNVVTLNVNQADAVRVGSVGATLAPAYFYVTSSQISADNFTVQPFQVEVYEGRPGFGGTKVCEETSNRIQGVKTLIQANPNSVDTISVSNSSPKLGEAIRVTITGATGTMGSGIAQDPNAFASTLASYTAWPASAFRLVNVEIDISPNGTLPRATYVNKLHLTGLGSAARTFEIRFDLEAVGATATETRVRPLQNIASGTQMKHTGSYPADGAITPIQPAENTVLVGKSVNDTTRTMLQSKVFEYTVTISSTANTTIDDVVDVMPAGATFVNASATLDDVAIVPQISGQTLTFPGPITLTANVDRLLVYELTRCRAWPRRTRTTPTAA